MRVYKVLTVLALSGCAVIAQPPASVGLLGGASIRTLATRLESAPPGAIRATQGIDAVGKAKPKVVPFVVNAPDGPTMPANREALKFMSQAGIKKFAIVFTGTTEIHDPELFGLIVKEAVELVKSSGLPGDQAPVILDAEAVRTDPKLQVKKGIKALQEYIDQNR